MKGYTLWLKKGEIKIRKSRGYRTFISSNTVEIKRGGKVLFSGRLVRAKDRVVLEGKINLGEGIAGIAKPGLSGLDKSSPYPEIFTLTSGQPKTTQFDSLYFLKDDLLLEIAAEERSFSPTPKNCRIRTSDPKEIILTFHENYYRTNFNPFFKPTAKLPPTYTSPTRGEDWGGGGINSYKFKKRFPYPPVGWLSWYCYFGEFNETEALKTADFAARYLKDFGFEYVQLENWQENRKMLKVAFPVTIKSNKAFYEIPFGAIGRSTTNNNFWEEAKKEVSALRWADLSDDKYGVSLLNDCKYGYDIKENIMRLTLLRAPTYPDPESDLGKHQFTYSLFLHQGNWSNSEVVKQGYQLNIPVLVVPIDSRGNKKADLPESTSLIQTKGLGVVISALKRSEDGKGFILRLYEPNGKAGKVTVTLPSEPKELRETNLMEEVKNKVPFRGNRFTFSLQPFQIKTFLYKLTQIQ